MKNLIPSFEKAPNGLLPVIVQDCKTAQVLMLAYMNHATYLETLQTGFAVYFSRSRQARWKKGETSGHVQKIVEIKLDCDLDTILLKVEQTGPACHTGATSCFFNQIPFNR